MEVIDICDHLFTSKSHVLELFFLLLLTFSLNVNLVYVVIGLSVDVVSCEICLLIDEGDEVSSVTNILTSPPDLAGDYSLTSSFTVAI